MLSVESIETHIAKDREELAKAQASGDEAKVRHYATELEGCSRHTKATIPGNTRTSPLSRCIAT